MAEKQKDLKSLTAEGLSTELSTAEKSLSELKFEHAVRGIQNPMLIRSSRKEVARVKTEVRARELAEMSPEKIAKRDRIRLRRRK